MDRTGSVGETADSRRATDFTADYYSKRFAQFGASPRGVDWNDERAQTFRFQQFNSLILDAPRGAVICDLGCGYGALADHIGKLRTDLRYVGIDLVADSLEVARSRAHTIECSFDVGSVPTPADLVVASGLFNVKGELDQETWRTYVHQTTTKMWEAAGFGIAFNVLSTASDKVARRDHLFYVSPSELVDLALAHTRNFSLSHDYGLYESTVILRTSART